VFKLEVNTLEELPAATSKFIAAFNGKKIFLFDAQMGAGKTTFIKELCHTLGVMDNMSSPTYSIVNEYTGAIDIIYHFDLYRVKNLNECLDIGMEEYLFSGNYCFIEWPEIANSLYPEDAVKVSIRIENEKRIIEAQ
jgi:tRNA threonylcarbamoyladenosine biosynthesis protein TsaE